MQYPLMVALALHGFPSDRTAGQRWEFRCGPLTILFHSSDGGFSNTLHGLEGSFFQQWQFPAARSGTDPQGKPHSSLDNDASV